ncbi:DNA helicase-2/ATP-dependent DNA helicase PcrA [Gillisia mitskevichiae]|uniref:DNA 3'-5' helicase II n=1 Tax=Gillisia mitskevichiae TaxID=270921 RepID=A0A495PWR4_9FLAO|nr:UvrD-helicase domain-containing protein [Gillisia mitskevichiae]RKS55595.1 DNA helicase-2/ATP-dependent DNA helicase PcrA [Gillisia mitskevichiae]|tara:strand:- start:317 stop:2203 length:1887 start_codon:yes stop_codon:yes gene_type:complete
MSLNDGNNVDDNVDFQISECLNPKSPKSFFLFAGAGSGKTRSLVAALTDFKTNHGNKFILNNQKIAIITYTNAAADEIKQRLMFDQIFYVSTIHSYAWELIQLFTLDIKSYVQTKLIEDIKDLELAQSKSRNLQNKTSIDRARKIKTKTKRLENLINVTRFTYNPNGDNFKKDSLNHSEVIGITADFIANEILMQDIVAARFPIILVDESQDTKKELIDALFTLQKNKKEVFSLGLFGDTMQRIYADGKPNLGESLPPDWVLPVKKMNHRSNKRIIKLINDIRQDVDEQKQQPRKEKSEGVVRLFIADRATDKVATEKTVAEKMSALTEDKNWIESDNVKTLILEHHMAAIRMGFFGIFQPLYKVDRLKTSLIDGSLSTLNLFKNTILPLIEAHKTNDKFSVMRIIKTNSTLFDKKIIENSKDQLKHLSNINGYVTKLLALWDGENDPSLKDILHVIYETKLFPLPSMFKVISSRTKDEQSTFENLDTEDEEPNDEAIEAWDLALEAKFSEVSKYNEYLNEGSKFATHQGVKGLEFPRVVVIIDDEEAKGFMFSYDKLFGTKDPSATDKKNEAEGNETGIDRTRRLFYVACSRAEESLAIIAYSDNPDLVKTNAMTYGWFADSEIEII